MREGWVRGASVAYGLEDSAELDPIIKQLGEQGELKSLAVVAETSLVTLRGLCDVPTICEELDGILDRLRRLRLDRLEPEED